MAVTALDSSVQTLEAAYPSVSRVALSYRLVRLSGLRSPRLLVGCVAASAVTLACARALLTINDALVFVAFLTVATAAALAAAERRRNRLVCLNLFFVAFATRIIALTVLFRIAGREGGPFLGPDSIAYFTGAKDLAASGLHLSVPPATFYGTYDVAHYYLFAAAIRYLQADLFALQLTNAGLTALAALLTFSVVTRIAPRGARAAGLVVALYPSLMVLSVVDLLKDPSIVFATLLTIWAIIRIVRVRRSAEALALVVPGALASIYLRTDRFYAFAYIEAAVLCASMWGLVRRRPRLPTLTATMSLLLLFGVAEAVPASVGWPTSPVLLLSQVAQVSGTSSMMHYSTGLADRMPTVSASGSRRVSFVANFARRTLGPFPWIAPHLWSVRYLESGDYLLYPGMLVWYALLPLILLGLTLTCRDIALASRPFFPLLFVWLFTTIYFAQYLAINLSYRQREVMFPFLVLFAWLGFVRTFSQPNFGRWYRGYWIALALFAVAHLSLRALMGA